MTHRRFVVGRSRGMAVYVKAADVAIARSLYRSLIEAWNEAPNVIIAVTMDGELMDLREFVGDDEVLLRVVSGRT